MKKNKMKKNKMKEKFFGVNEIHTIHYNKEDEVFYIGMEVQGLDNDKVKEFVMLFDKDDLEYFSYTLKKILKGLD